MTNEPDHYAILGILPDAEQVVVIAAYRALASLYHPDRWKGDLTEATRRMADINVAYATLGDVVKRRAYDAPRKSEGHGTYESGTDEKDSAFDEALDRVEDRWQLAVNIFPDLADIRRRLSKTAHRLAFAFVTVMLDTRQFEKCQAVAENLEKRFLERYFGTNEKVIGFAKELILRGLKDAVVALNRYVDVLGSSVEPGLLISKIENDFGVELARLAVNDASGVPIEDVELLRKIAKLKRTIRGYPPAAKEEALTLASLVGYGVIVTGKGIFAQHTYQVRNRKTQQVMGTFNSEASFVKWVRETI